MACGFGTGVGVGTTDYITTDYAAGSTLRSWFIRAYRISDGSGNTFGSMIDKRADNGVAREFVLGNRGDLVLYSIIIGWSGTLGEWRFTQPAINAWDSILVTYDGGSTANDPVVYLNGTSISVARITAPSGSLLNNASTYSLGNRPDGTRCWDGYLADAAIWDRILTADEATALHKGFSPLWLKLSLVWHVPMVRANVNMYGATPTVTGTAVQPHPRIIYQTTTRRDVAFSSGGVGSKRLMLLGCG